MFGKTFLVSISLISLAWIGYVAYDLLNDAHLLHPEVVFSEADGNILIINRSQEVDITQLDFAIPEKSKVLVEQLLATVLPNEQLFISQKRNIVLVKNTTFWTDELLTKYLNQKGLANERLENNWMVNATFELSFDKNNLLFKSKNETLIKETEHEWPLWDPLASASIIHLNKPLKSTNIYFKADGTIAYETNIGKALTGKKVDDGDLFSQELPASCTNYHFISKDYALETNYLKTSSPLYEWMEDGFVLFDYQGEACLMSDDNKMTEPTNLLSSNENTDFYQEKLVTSPYFENGFYLTQVGDKIVLSSNQETLNKIKADYQLGKTLALNETAFQAIFAKMPKKVSERLIASSQKVALSTYQNLVIKTVLVAETSTESTPKIVETIETQNYTSFGIQGSLIQLVQGQTATYAFTNANRLLGIQHQQQQFQFNLDANLLGEAKEIDAFSNGSSYLFFNTKNKLYLLDNKGNNASGFPLEIPCTNIASTYKWNNKSNFLIVNINNELLQIDDKGRILKKLKLNCGEVKNEIDVYRAQGKLIANIRGDKEFVTVDLDRNKILKKHPKISHESLAIKTASGFDYYFINEKGLQRINSNYESIAVLPGADLKNMKRIKLPNQQFITCHNGSTIFILDQNASIKKVNVNIKDIEDYDVLIQDNQVKAIAILDGVQNKITVLNANGKVLNSKAFEGKDKVKLSINRNQLSLTSSIQDNLVQYFDVLNQ